MTASANISVNRYRVGASTVDPHRSGFLAAVRRFPMLEPQEEYTLAKGWRERQETGAAERLVPSHLRLVVTIAVRYRGYGLPISELISEGHVGLMPAVKRFAPD